VGKGSLRAELPCKNPPAATLPGQGREERLVRILRILVKAQEKDIFQ